MDYKEELVRLLAKDTGLKPSELTLLITVPPDSKMGDFAFPCFKMGKNPKEEAEKLMAKLVLPDFVSRVEVAGPYLNSTFLAQDTLHRVLKEGKLYGQGKRSHNIVVEYCGPNTNKPLHLGHMRNMALGNAMVHLLSFQGNKVHPVNIINDRGIHICQSMLAYQKWGEKAKPTKKGDHYVGDFYVLFAKCVKENPELKEEAQSLLVKWENKDKETRTLWKKMNGWVLSGFAQTYKRFGVSFEKEYFESEYYENGKDVAFDGLKRDVFMKDDKGGIMAPLAKHGIADKVILRGDGTSLYITQDMYLAEQRYRDFKFDLMVYVVASEQQLHFKQLFKIMELLGQPFATSLYHLSYGLVNLPTGRMKSREGTVVDADDLMDEVSALARAEVEKRAPELSEKEKVRRAEFIALGAIKFFLVRTDPVRDIVFDPEESISFDGETGPYLQYTHARACSILRKAGAVKGKLDYGLLVSAQEKNLISMLAAFAGKVDDSAAHYRPHVLCRYLLDLAQVFNEFYHSSPVISENKELMKARLQLVDAVRQVMLNGLTCLGIYAPEEM